MEALAAQGAAIAPNVRTLAMEADVIMSCLFNDDAVKEVYGGDEGHTWVNRNPQRLKAGFCYLPVLCADPAAGVSATAASDVSSRKVSVSCRYRVTVVSEWLK